MSVKYLKRVAITGGEGLIGSSIGRAFKKSNINSVSIDLSINNQHDITNKQIENVLNQIDPSLVFHAAAHPGGKSLKEPLSNTKINVLGTMRILNWCIKKKNSNHIY